MWPLQGHRLLLPSSASGRSQHQQARQSSRRPPRACTAHTPSRLAPAAPSVKRTPSIPWPEGPLAPEQHVGARIHHRLLQQGKSMEALQQRVSAMNVNGQLAACMRAASPCFVSSACAQ
ncbi:hypothetical protein GOP47_0010453 [Adiantum capillus-veneris]|uniref:Uncharacterized protein n=1 Tax=Adiantum capillus-veneris TaxID=13818 RepID=A0A9D4UVB0_ADICA|nr:hypothetical protein GOP47_0010453 [Adiantum capillus-veneris]